MRTERCNFSLNQKRLATKIAEKEEGKTAAVILGRFYASSQDENARLIIDWKSNRVIQSP